MASASSITDQPEQQQQRQQLQSLPTLKCPRCDSSNTKFCYYNNYSLSQPRHFCKACKRYWTRGGTLRNVPVGGACRKNKGYKTSSSSIASTPNQNPSLLNSIISTSPMIFGVHNTNPSGGLGFSSFGLTPSHIGDLREGFDSAKQNKGILLDSNHDHHPAILFDRNLQLSGNFETSFTTPMKEVKMDGMNRLFQNRTEQIDTSNFSNPSHYWNSGTTATRSWHDPTSNGFSMSSLF